MKVCGRDRNVKIKMFGRVEVIVCFVVTNQPKNMFRENARKSLRKFLEISQRSSVDPRNRLRCRATSLRAWSNIDVQRSSKHLVVV